MDYKENPLIPYELNEKYRLDCWGFVVFMFSVALIGYLNG